MMEIQQTGDPEALIANALERMPNFSTEIQSNNVLSKRILALKQKDGISSKEAEK
jgi:hypothetical protein